MNDIKLKRWLQDSVCVILGMHPTHAAKAKAIWHAMQKMGFTGTFQHAKKAMSLLRDTVLYSPERGYWALTATGQARQNQIIRDMQEVITLHKMRTNPRVVESMTDVPESPLKAIVYKPNVEGRLACVVCGTIIGREHSDGCRAA